MKTLIAASLAACMVLGGAGAAAARPHDDNGWNNSWRRGGHIDRTAWGRSARVDWRAHHLRAPPHGYEWREVNGRYVLAAVATGVIADIILNSR